MSVRTRLEQSADELFSKQGYTVTPVRDVMKHAGVVPRSFYDTFASKKDLGLLYLRRREEESMHDLQTLMQQYPDPKGLFRAWVLTKKRQIKKGEFFGCPFIRFSLQMNESDEDFLKQLRSVSQMWEDILCNYLSDSIKKGFLPKSTDILSLARHALAIYEGNIAMWRISGSMLYIDQMTIMFESILQSHLLAGKAKRK